MKSADNLFVSHSENSLSPVEFIFGLAAARALPVGGQIFKDDGQFVFVERLVGEVHAHDIFAGKIHSVGFRARHVDFGVGEFRQLAGMVSVLVRDENFGNLFRLIASGFERVDVEFNAFAEENLRLIVNNLFGEIFGFL